MKRFVNKIKFLPIVAGILSSSVPMLNVALAVAVSLTMGINNTSGTSYTAVPFIKNTNNELLISGGQLLPSGLDSRVLNSSGTSLPRMLADNNTLFVADSAAHTSSTLTFTTGNTPSSTMPIITGVSGNVSTNDAPDLELDRHFDVSISGYFNTSTNGTNVSPLYKQGAAKINISAPNTITFHALNADDSDNWTMSGAMSSGNHTVRVWADGTTAHLDVDGVETDTEPLATTIFQSLGSIASQGNIEDPFYAAGRYWVFVKNNVSTTNVDYYTSTDGTTWSSATNLISDNTATQFSVYFDTLDNTHVAYVKVNGTPSPDQIYYRRGVPQADGSITWDSGEVSVGNYNVFNIPQLAISSGGYPFIFFHGTIGATTGYYITRSSTNDGSWSTSVGYPQNFGVDNGVVEMSIAAFASGNCMIAAWVNWSSFRDYVYAKYYNGSSWSANEQIIYDSTHHAALGKLIVDNSGQVYASLAQFVSGVGTYGIKIRSTGGSWGSYIQVPNVTNNVPAISYDITANILYIFYSPSSVGLKYRVLSGGALGSEVSITGDAFNYSMVSVNKESSHFFANAWTSGTTEKVGIITFPWEWSDTANSWWWMTNNSMSYADNITLAVQGSQYLLYAPNNMIYGNQLPDRSAVGTHTGTIYWGTSTLTVSGAALITLPATNITTNSAMLNGQLLDMVGMSSFTAYFDFGLTTAYGNTASFGVMSAPGLLSANASGLFSGTTYHFRAVAVSSNITLYGGDLTFTTTGQPGGGTFQFGGGNARVFKNYITANDTLITAEIVNTYVPYYPNQSPKEYFTVQLISTDNSTILAATPQQDWGDKPIGIYLNPTQSATITDGAGYYVRVQANFASNVSVQYQLQNVPWANDWKGADLTKLDDWAIYVALDMQTFYSGSGYVTVLTDRKLAITDAVGGYFTAGIAGIGQIRPNLFTTSQQSPVFSSGISALPTDNLTAYTAYVGSNIATDAAVIATPFGLTARDVLAGIICLAMLGVIMTGTSMMGGFGALGLFLISIPFLWLGTYFKIIGVQWVMILTIIFGFFAVRQFIIKTT